MMPSSLSIFTIETMKPSVPVATSVILFAALVGTSQFEHQQLNTVAASRDSVQQTLNREREYEGTLLSTGDTLPAASIQGLDRKSTTLRALDHRFKYVIFRTLGCSACDEMSRLIPSIPTAVRDSVALVDVGSKADTLPTMGVAHFLWRRDSLSKRQFIHYVPTVIVRDTSGRVLAAGHGSFQRAFNVLDLFHMVPKAVVDSVHNYDPTLASLADGSTRIP
jgi:hypothetical protein